MILLSGLMSLTGLLSPAAPARAQDISDVIEVQLRPGWRTKEGRHMAGVEIRLAPGWKTYWRAPGDGGIPPLFDWQGSENLTGATFHWPVPEVTWPNGMRTIGYSDAVTLPVEFTLADPSAPARVSARVQLGVCEDICVPVELRIDALLPAAGGGRDPVIVAAIIDRPLEASEAGAGQVVCEVAPMEYGMQVTARLPLPARFHSNVVVIEAGDPEVWVSEPEVSQADGMLTAQADLLHVSGGAFALDRSALRFTVLTPAGEAVDLRGCVGG